MTKQIGICQLPRILALRGMTQQQLSDRTKLSVTQLSDYANNRRTMSLKNATIIAGALGCAVEDLYVWVSQSNHGDRQ